MSDGNDDPKFTAPGSGDTAPHDGDGPNSFAPANEDGPADGNLVRDERAPGPPSYRRSLFRR
jgi:hypothetical protein